MLLQFAHLFSELWNEIGPALPILKQDALQRASIAFSDLINVNFARTVLSIAL
jgi:hypothetical protein